MIQIPRLSDDPLGGFPPTTDALVDPNGLLAWGGDLDPRRLLDAYSQGIFPWFSEDEPLLWWSPAPRCVLFPDRIHISRRLGQKLRQGRFRLTADTAFAEVIAGCAEPRQDGEGTWITSELCESFEALHKAGYAHSVEAWDGEQLAGGLYGIALGRVFFAESMFHRVTDAGKIALVTLCRHLSNWGYEVIDCQIDNPHLLSLGAESIARERFENMLNQDGPPPGSWTDHWEG